MSRIRRPAQTPENIRLICDISLVLMLLTVDRSDFRGYEIATEMSARYPSGSYENVFWWSVRTLYDDVHAIKGEPGPHEPLEEFWKYFAWKLDQYNKGWLPKGVR